MHPRLIDLGFYEVPTYGVLVAVGVLLGLWTAKLRADRTGLDGSKVVDFSLWIVIWALLGAKLLYVLVGLPRFLADPGLLLTVVRSGGVFLGGFIGALVAAAVLLRRYGLPCLATVDVLAPSLSLGQAVGRIGCLAAGCCWGSSCDLPWAITYTDARAAATVGTPLHVALHPFPVYAALLNLALFGGLAALHRRRPAPGRVFSAYLVGYGLGRFALEWTRGDRDRGFVLGGALSTSQAITAIMIVVGVGLWIWAGRRARP
jgi:phosphatidylglycerol:prolipoprotein diacylglycerol transferase